MVSHYYDLQKLTCFSVELILSFLAIFSWNDALSITHFNWNKIIGYFATNRSKKKSTYLMPITSIAILELNMVESAI